MENIKTELNLTLLTKERMPDALALIAEALNPRKATWAERGMKFHFSCLENDLHDGRDYYIWEHNGIVSGIVGLHHYDWGPKENIWLSWLAVSNNLQGQRYGRKLLLAIEKLAALRGYKKFYIETYGPEEFETAKRFYIKMGFEESGRIQHYLPNNEDLVMFFKPITDQK